MSGANPAPLSLAKGEASRIAREARIPETVNAIVFRLPPYKGERIEVRGWR